MNYVSGKTIRSLREKRNLTQKALARLVNVSDKAISKWETEKGLPDIGVLGDLSQALGVSIAELMTGDLKANENTSSNMKKSRFYICPICGNSIMAVGEGCFSCCGVTLPPLEAEPCDEAHSLTLEEVDGEYYVTMRHEMSKTHYISLIAYVTLDSLEVVKLYPEQDVSVRFRKKGPGFLYAYCNRHGLFCIRV